jgi:putative peptide zinc metalloprotease protein
MAVADARTSVWEALAGHGRGRAGAPADPGLWAAVVERLNPARATPALRPGIERADLVSARDSRYVMFRSPDPDGDAGAGPHYLRLGPDEAALAELMDGERTVAQLVSEYARLSGRLAPDQVARLVADLAANRMLEELPVESFRPAHDAPGPSWPARLGSALLRWARGRRLILGDAGRFVSLLHRAGGRYLFNPAAAGIIAMFAVAGFGLFVWGWWQGGESVFLAGRSYATGAVLLLVLYLVGSATHELGHALAARHAGRRPSAAGLLLQYGVPAVFVDTSDVWLAGRRARLLTTLAGPAAGLSLAGFAQIVGLLFPPAAGVAFKLAFVVYLGTLVSLNPLLPLDGHYLLADWLEVPHLRSRALAWLRARVRVHRPMPRLDGEGRLIALYAGAAVLWTALTVGLVWRIWADRVAGAATGAGDSGWGARLLFGLVVLVLAAPLLHTLAGWLVRATRRLLRRRAVARGGADDEARRLAVLRSSPLGHLATPALADLAARAIWLHPHRGERVVRAGAVAPNVLVVAEGAVEGRAPGDPAGTVRQRVGLGGVIGLAGALTGEPTPLAWHTVGTTLLAVPAPAVAAAVGPLPGPSPAERTEIEALFAETPAVEALPAEDRMALAVVAAPQDLGPGEPVHLRLRNSSVIVGSGVIVLPEGTALRRGTMIGPVDADLTEPVAYTRTEVRLWMLPPVAQLPTLLGGPDRGGAATEFFPPSRTDRPTGGLGRAAGQAPVIGGEPREGTHPTDRYPPLAAPPGPPPDCDDAVDRRFERGLWGLVGAVGVAAVLVAGGVALPGPAWAELPADRAMLTAERGPVTATVDGRARRLTADDRLYLGADDLVEVGGSALARLTFRGGSTVVLCPGSRARLGDLSATTGRRPIQLTAGLRLDHGRMLADTATPSRSYDPLALTVTSVGQSVVSAGSAWYVVGVGEAKVSSGQVRRGGVPIPTTSAPLTCGDGVPVPRPAGTPAEPTPPPLAVPTPTATPTRSATPSARPERPDPTATPTPAGSPTGRPAPTRTAGGQPPPVDPPPDPPPGNEPPTISWVEAPGGTLAQQGGPDYCGSGSASAPVSVAVADDDGADALTVTLSWSGFEVGSTTLGGGATRSGTVGPVTYPGADNSGGTLTVEVSASDGEFVRRVSGAVEVASCQAPPPPEGQ